MNKSNLFKNRVNNSGQSLAEMAVFGSLLLLVFGFLLRYGLQNNYQQQVKMEVFRRALQIAYDSDVAKSHDVVLFKDVHIPNPQDIFGQGDRQTIRGSAGITWNSGGSKVDYASTELSPSTKYIFNPDKKFAASGSTYNETSGKPAASDLIVKEFTTAALTGTINGDVVVNTPLILKGESTPYIVKSSNQAKVYEQEEGYDSKEVMILKSQGRDCNNQYCEKNILAEVEFGRYAPYPSGLRYFPVHTVYGDKGDTADSFLVDFVDEHAGQLNSTLVAKQTENRDNERHSSLALTEDSAKRSSTDILDETESVNHVIMTRDGDRSPTFVFHNDISKTWTTPK